MADFLSLNAGSIILLTPATPAAAQWAEDHIESAWCEPGETVEIDRRCFLDIAIGLLSEGFTLQDAATGRMAPSPRLELSVFTQHKEQTIWQTFMTSTGAHFPE